MLASALPSILAWGRELTVCAYNHAYAPLLGDRSGPFGSPLREVWLEPWEVAGPRIEAAFAGEPAPFQTLALDLTREGRREPAWFDSGLAGVRDEAGALAGVLGTLIETTPLHQALAERGRHLSALAAREATKSVLLRLGDALRSLSDAAQVQKVAAHLLGEHLEASRVQYAEVLDDQTTVEVRADFHRQDVPVLLGRRTIDAFGPFVSRILKSGRTLKTDDNSLLPGAREAEQAAYAAAGVRANVSVPLVKGGRLAAFLTVHQAEPRHWTDQEVGLIEEVAERTWEATERARAETALRESETRYRTLFDSIDEGFCIIEMLYDAQQRPVDYRFLEVNAAFERQTGLPDAVGKTMRSLAPRHEQHWYDAYGRIALSGEPERFELSAAELGHFYDVYAFRMGRPEEHRVGVLFQDISERKRAEEHRSLLIHELNHRVKNTLAIVQSFAHQTFRGDKVPDRLLETFEGRLVALSGAHDLLTRENWHHAWLEEVAAETLSGCGAAARSVTLGGPPVMLEPKLTVTVAMALHELCTNAVKHGALGSHSGRVGLSWTVTDGEPQRLNLVWREENGPPVEAPAHHGFGLRMIARALGAELNGTVKLDFAPNGLVCLIEIDLPEVGAPAPDLPEPPSTP
ncbi:MAG: HWE histidine kinase domain-containing protein [Tistlia sp.]